MDEKIGTRTFDAILFLPLDRVTLMSGKKRKTRTYEFVTSPQEREEKNVCNFFP
jgi:hypothetical protein